MANNDRYDDLMELRRATIETRREMLAQEASNLAEDINRENQAAREHLKNGDTEAAQGAMENIMRLEADLQSRYLELGPRDENQMSAAKQAWIARRRDLINPVTVEGAGLFHDYITKKMGVRDDSPEYFELMGHVLEPDNYQPMITPDEAAKISGVDARTYNQGVRQFMAEKAAGRHRDK
jgi:hypothetical protein